MIRRNSSSAHGRSRARREFLASFLASHGQLSFREHLHGQEWIVLNRWRLIKFVHKWWLTTQVCGVRGKAGVLFTTTDPWQRTYSWDDWGRRQEIQPQEWRHLRWFYNYCHWRAAGRSKFGVTGIGSACAGTGNSPCEVLFNVLEKFHQVRRPHGTTEWEPVYLQLVRKASDVKGKKGVVRREKPLIVGWPEAEN